jgi:ketosteroid isomerase-like protein
MNLKRLMTVMSLGVALAASADTLAEPPAVPPMVGDLPQASASDLADFRHQADALYRMKEHAFAREDADTIVDRFYAKDAVSFGPEGKPVIGRDAFRHEYKTVVKIANVKIEPISNHVGTDAAWEWVNFRAFPRDSAQKPFTFIMVFLWAKKNGTWVCGGDAYTVGQFSQPE